MLFLKNSSQHFKMRKAKYAFSFAFQLTIERCECFLSAMSVSNRGVSIFAAKSGRKNASMIKTAY